MVATRHSSADVMSGSSGPMKLEVKNCVTANVPPATSTAGHVSRTPFRPSISQTRKKGTNTRQQRQLPAGHLADQHRINPGRLAGDENGDAERAEGDRRRVGDQAQAGGVEWIESRVRQGSRP